MSRDNVELIRRLYDDFNNGDLDALIESFSTDAEQVVTVLGQTHRGREEIRRSFEEYFEVVDAHRTEPIEFIEEDDWVVAPVRLYGRLRHTGITGDMIPTEMVHAFAVHDGQIVWNYICTDKDEAIEAARAGSVARGYPG
jgi:ketosteroid isomerase-like protein